jgi:hypothetical protein
MVFSSAHLYTVYTCRIDHPGTYYLVIVVVISRHGRSGFCVMESVDRVSVCSAVSHNRVCCS